MNNVMRRIWIMAGSFVVITAIAYLFFMMTNMQCFPVYFWLIPALFLLLTLVLGLIVKKYTSEKKDLSIGSILGIRMFFIAVITVAIIVNILVDREHIISLAVLYVVFALFFLVFETQIMLMLNKKNY